MVGCCPCLVNAKHPANLRNETTFKLAPLIRVELLRRWEAEKQTSLPWASLLRSQLLGWEWHTPPSSGWSNPLQPTHARCHLVSPEEGPWYQQLPTAWDCQCGYYCPAFGDRCFTPGTILTWLTPQLHITMESKPVKLRSHTGQRLFSRIYYRNLVLQRPFHYPVTLYPLWDL